MLKLRNFKDWKTTVTGIVTAVVALLVLFGVITPEQSADVSGHALNFVEAVALGIASVAGLVLVFGSRDG